MVLRWRTIQYEVESGRSGKSGLAGGSSLAARDNI
jgi:hypothetical protein